MQNKTPTPMKKSTVIAVVMLLLALAVLGFGIKYFIEKPEKLPAKPAQEEVQEEAQEEVQEEETELTPVQEENLSTLSAELIDPLDLVVTDIDVSDLKEEDIDVYGFSERGADDYEFCQEIGARVVHIPEYSTYFAYWLPDNWDQLEEKRALVMMHGSVANAYAMFPHLYDTAEREEFALISLQWGWVPDNSGSADYVYLHDSEEGLRVAYDLMTVALDYVELHFDLDKELSAWNGFSRGSSASVAYAYLDKESENDYFQLFMSIAGPANSLNSLVANILDGTYGDNALDGKNFYLWCGTANVNVTADSDGEIVNTCERMTNSFHPLSSLGASVEFIETEGGEHDTWNESTELQKEAVDLWMSF